MSVNKNIVSFFHLQNPSEYLPELNGRQKGEDFWL